MAIHSTKFRKSDGIIQLLSFLRTPQTLSEITTHLGLTDRSVWRYIRELTRIGILIQHPSSKYSLYSEDHSVKGIIFETPGGEKVVNAQDFLIIPFKGEL